jgi:hypothetical protein
MSVTRPFYALDTRWAAGITTVQDTRINSLFVNGDTQAQFRHRQSTVDAFGGWSRGLVDGWVQRYSLGINYQKHAYNTEGDLPAPTELPPDQTLVAPYLRYQILEDSYEQFKNLDLIQRPEYQLMGFQSSVQLGRSLTSLGSTQELWLYRRIPDAQGRNPAHLALQRGADRVRSPR